MINKNSKLIYGIVTASGEHIDISRSEKGTKRYATNNGYDRVSVRHEGHYYVTVIAEKRLNGWFKI